MRKRVLLVEDEPMITLLYEDVLEDSEFELVGVMTCNKDAVAHIDLSPPDLAIIDYALRDGPCLPVMNKLAELSIPVLIASGYSETENTLGHEIWLEKPFVAEKLLAALRDLSETAFAFVPPV